MTLPPPSVPAAASTAPIVAKRPADASPLIFSDDEATFSQKPAQRPRLDIMKVNFSYPEHKTKQIRVVTDDEPASSVGANFDLLTHAASFMHPNNILYNLCVAFGPRIATVIRQKYLLSNEAYLVSSLRPLFTDEIRGRYWLGYSEHRDRFDKCGRNVEAWMAVNANWRSRCSDDKMKKYRQAECAEEGGELIFNNPLVALELGLYDVLRMHMEAHGVLPYDDRWRGIVAHFIDDGSYGNHFPGTNVFHQALMRRNTKILQYILSHEEFSMDALSAVVRQEGAEIVLFALGEIGVPIEAREAFVRHPKVTKSLNGLDNMMLDCRAPPLLRIMEHSSLFDQTADEEARIKSKRLIDMLLDAGADPSVEVQPPTNYRFSSRGDKPRSATEYARRQLEQHPNDPLRKALMRKIDLWGFD